MTKERATKKKCVGRSGEELREGGGRLWGLRKGIEMCREVGVGGGGGGSDCKGLSLSCLYLFTAPGPVQNLRVVYTAELSNFNSGSRMYDLNVTISWEAPSEPNGVILAYSYRLVATDNTSNVIIGDTNTTNLSVLDSVTVSPFTNYTATVVAYTSAGGGNSVMEVAISPEASKFI